MMKTKAYLINEVTDGMIPLDAVITKQDDNVRINLPGQRLTICVKLEDIQRISKE